MPVDVVVARSLQDRPAGELRLLVTDNNGRPAIDPHKRTQFLCHAVTRDAGIGHQTQVLAAAIIVHRQNAEPTRSPERVGQEVQRPTLTWSQRLRHRRPRATGPLAAPSPPDTQLLVGLKPIESLVVHDHTFAFQHHANPPIAKPPPLGRDGLHLFSDLWIVPLSSKLRFDCRGRRDGRSRRTVLGSAPTSLHARRCEIS